MEEGGQRKGTYVVEDEKFHHLREHTGGAALQKRKAGWTPKRKVATI